MGAYKYIGELYKKKQSDVLRFLLRVRYVVVSSVTVRRTLITDVK
jgi:ribosomal protein L15E